MRIKRFLSWAFVFCWMVFIFMFSHQEAAESSEMSLGVVDKVIVTVDEVYPQAEYDYEEVHFLVRKTAHFSIYAFLGVLVTNALYLQGWKVIRVEWLALLCCMLYAISDEVHQLFIIGRSGEARDVLVDSGGAGIGIALYYATIIKGKIHRIYK